MGLICFRAEVQIISSYGEMDIHFVSQPVATSISELTTEGAGEILSVDLEQRAY